jgi:hypothetical protein
MPLNGPRGCSFISTIQRLYCAAVPSAVAAGGAARTGLVPMEPASSSDSSAARIRF